MNVTAIATRGRPKSSEYVLEYAISYGTNGLDYSDFKEAGGNIKVGVKHAPNILRCDEEHDVHDWGFELCFYFLHYTSLHIKKPLNLFASDMD
jgi:hypothetical protein